MGVSVRSGRNTKSTKHSAVQGHMLNCDNTVLSEDFSVLGNGSNTFRKQLQEIRLINWDRSQLNKTYEVSPFDVTSH